MENQYQKIVNIAYLAVAALVAFVSLMGLMTVSSLYDLESRIRSIEYVVRGLSLLLGAGVFFGLYLNPKANAFMNEVAVELLTKVTWPTKKDTWSATIIVIITVILAGLVLAFFDWIFTVALNWLWDAARQLFV